MTKSIFNDVITYYTSRHYHATINGETTSIQKTYAFGSISVTFRNDGVLNWLLGGSPGQHLAPPKPGRQIFPS
jgi:hypothetical protein